MKKCPLKVSCTGCFKLSIIGASYFTFTVLFVTLLYAAGGGAGEDHITPQLTGQEVFTLLESRRQASYYVR